MKNAFDFVIVGGGIVGLSIAYQLVERKISNKIIIVDKEPSLGLHSSGRNSGVIHAGIYYEPNSLKAKVCVSGAKRLKEWINDKKVNFKNCGKLIIPQKAYLDPQLDILYKRGIKNGAILDFVDAKFIQKMIPEANITSGRGLWSPNTSVIDPLQVINLLKEELESKGVSIITSARQWKINHKSSQLIINDNQIIKFGFFINSAGLEADKIAHIFNVGLEYKIIPFKGLYWQLNRKCPLNIKFNLYPVPDLNVPFLGVHFTPNAIDDSVIIGPTAIPALGRENYTFFKNINFQSSINNFSFLAKQYFLNKDGFRKYVHEQAFLGVPFFFLKSAQDLIPSIKFNDIKRSNKVGIRAQVFNMKNNQMIKDFLCLHGEKSLHIVNAISPAFTASFALADHIIDNYLLNGIKNS